MLRLCHRESLRFLRSEDPSTCNPPLGGQLNVPITLHPNCSTWNILTFPPPLAPWHFKLFHVEHSCLHLNPLFATFSPAGDLFGSDHRGC
jgi:hypothetical protein